MKTVLSVLLGVLMVLYPLLVYLGLQQLNVRAIALLLLALALIRFAVVRKATLGRGQGTWLLLVAVLIALLALVTNEQDYFLFYPFAVNAAMLGLFSSSLIFPPTVIERLARLQEPDLPASGVQYTRKVTIAWCCFFVVNGAIALYTALCSSLEIWTLYNGLIAYIAMGALFAGEFAVRHLIVRR